MKYFSAAVALACPLLANSGAMPGPQDRHVDNAGSAVHVRLIAAEDQWFEVNDQTESCGINYSAKVIDTIAGKAMGEDLQFSSVFPLLIGEQYIVLLGQEAPHYGMVVEWPQKYADAYNECEKRLNPEKISERDAPLVMDYPPGLDGRWIMLLENDTRFKLKHSKLMRCADSEHECLYVPFDEFIDSIK